MAIAVAGDLMSVSKESFLADFYPKNKTKDKTECSQEHKIEFQKCNRFWVS